MNLFHRAHIIMWCCSCSHFAILFGKYFTVALEIRKISSMSFCLAILKWQRDNGPQPGAAKAGRFLNLELGRSS